MEQGDAVLTINRRGHFVRIVIEMTNAEKVSVADIAKFNQCCLRRDVHAAMFVFAEP